MRTLLAFVSFFFVSSLAFAQNEEVPPAMPPGQSMWQGVAIVVIVFLFLYFIIFRPEMKRRKALEEQRKALQVGDQVTAMGILGKVVKITEATVVLQLYDGAKMEVMKAAINDVVPGNEPKKNG